MYTIAHAIFAYFFLLLTVRALSRRPGGQMTLFEFVIVFLLGGIAILATVGDDRSETNGVCALITVGLLHRAVSKLKARFLLVQKMVDGVPLVLIKGGQWQTNTMGKMRLQDTDVMAAAANEGDYEPH